MSVGLSGGRYWARLLSVTLVCVVAFAGSAARAEGPGDEAEAVEAPAEQPTFKFSGRVFALAAADQRADYARDLSIPTARLQVKAGYGIAQAVLEADVASKSLIKDAYIRLQDKDHGLRLYAGQFKAPFLQREQISRWDLPLVTRGLVDGYLVDLNGFGGRRIGAMAAFRQKHWKDLELEVGAFRGSKDALGQRLGEDLSARATFEPWKKRLQLGVDGYWADFTHGSNRFAGGADATLLLGQGAISLEGLAGHIALGPFTAQILTASWLFAIDSKAVWSVQPVVGGEGLQLRGEQAGTGQAAVLGLNVLYADRVKLMLQGERGLYPGDQRLQNRFAVQLAARF